MKKTNEVSKLTGVSKRTLQYYDDENLLSVERSPYNHRLYDEKSLEQIWQILFYKEMGFNLADIRHLLTLSESEQKRYLKQRIEVILQQIRAFEEQISFISSAINKGIPSPQDADITKVTYTTQLQKLKEKWIKDASHLVTTQRED